MLVSEAVADVPGWIDPELTVVQARVLEEFGAEQGAGAYGVTLDPLKSHQLMIDHGNEVIKMIVDWDGDISLPPNAAPLPCKYIGRATEIWCMLAGL